MNPQVTSKSPCMSKSDRQAVWAMKLCSAIPGHRISRRETMPLALPQAIRDPPPLRITAQPSSGTFCNHYHVSTHLTAKLRHSLTMDLYTKVRKDSILYLYS